jgi:hypothetical protein
VVMTVMVYHEGCHGAGSVAGGGDIIQVQPSP